MKFSHIVFFPFAFELIRSGKHNLAGSPHHRRACFLWTLLPLIASSVQKPSPAPANSTSRRRHFCKFHPLFFLHSDREETHTLVAVFAGAAAAAEAVLGFSEGFSFPVQRWMSGLGHQEITYEGSSYDFIGEPHEGTSARTRPFSFDEIMHRRKAKKLAADVKERADKLAKDVKEEAKDLTEDSKQGAKRLTEDAKQGAKTLIEDAKKGSDRLTEDVKNGVEKTERLTEDVKDGVEKLRVDAKWGVRDSVKVSLKSKVEVVSGYLLGDDSSNRSRDSNLGIKKPTLDDVWTDSRKRDAHARTNHDQGKARRGHDRDLETNLKLSSEKDSGHKNEIGDRYIVRSNVDERSRLHSDRDNRSKNFRDTKGEFRYMESSRGTFDGGSKRKGRTADVPKYNERHDKNQYVSGRGHALEYADRKTKIESSYSHGDESRLKRRRSRSQEQSKDRYRGRVSPSLNDENHFSSHKHDQDEVSLHSQKERYARHHSDADKKRMSSNGSRSHYNKHEDSFSRLGGYSPRKRKTVAAVKTPPPKRSPDKMSAPRELPPTGSDRPLKSLSLSGEQLTHQTKPSDVVDLGHVSVATNVVKPFYALPSNKLSLVMSASIDSIQLTQATRPMRRLYVENVPSSASEKEIMECLNNFLLSSGVNHIPGTKPCISCVINKEKNQALVEFLTPEDASAALAFDGRYFSGRVLKIRRPKDFIDVTRSLFAYVFQDAVVCLEEVDSDSCFQTLDIFMQTGSSEKSMAQADTVVSHSISDFVKDSPHKIFIGGISDVISSEMLMEIASVFGPLKAYHFDANNLVNEPCAFLEYSDQSVTLKACAGLNGLKIGGRVLIVAQAIPNAMITDDTESPPSYKVPEHVLSLLEKPTPVLKLKNVLDPEVMKSLSEAELEEIVEDVKLECARFGAVKSVNVVKSAPLPSEPLEVRDGAESCQTRQDLMESREDGGNYNAKGSNTMKHPKNFEEHSAKDEMVNGNQNPVDKLGSFLTDPSVAAAGSGQEHVSDGKSTDAAVESSKDHDDDDKANTTGNQPATSEIRSELTVKGALDREDAERDPAESNEALANDKSTESNIESNRNTQDASLSGEVKREGQEDTKLHDGEGNDKAETVPDFGSVFEVGCVLVEFRRSEASSMAAHSLHGRPFDDRVVSVEYVPHNQYKARFPK
ncbi:Splicing factor U2AF 50 kDa subunit-like protein [Drosera capensis]